MRRVLLVLFMAIACASSVYADPIQITAGVGVGCAINCDASPNNLGAGTNIGFYIPGKTASASKELLVLLVPNDTTNLFATNPLGAVTLYNTNPLSATGSTGTSSFAAPGTLGLGSGTLSYLGGGFWGVINSNSGSNQVGSDLGIGLSSSINMSNVASASNSGTSQFGVYVFQVNAAIGGQQLLNINIPNGLPEGTFASVVTNTGLANPNSSAGVVTSPVPEPATAMLIGSGLVAIGGYLRKRRRATTAAFVKD
jgi:hypothetical protein